MQKKALRADGMLLLTSVVWGLAFVAQRVGMEHIGPFAFNGIRFALGSLSLLPLIRFFGRRNRLPAQGEGPTSEESRSGTSTSDTSASGTSRSGISASKTVQGHQQRLLLMGSLAAGAVLFVAASLQQIGIQYTTAGKAGFLTGLYVVLVPIAGMAFGHTTGLPTWLGAVLAAAGMYVLSAPGNVGSVNPGDVLVILGALFWTAHVLVIDYFSRRIDPVTLASAQFAWCALFSLAAALVFETVSLEAIGAAAVPILYGGIVSVGVGYTLQVVAQRDAPPAHASILMSLEGVFATISGILFLAEPVGLRSVVGSLLMLTGMIATQWDVIFRSKSA
ncbi:MAG TPA: EamA family transporter [Spirochaetaceae bacterium]|nr:EamA family transporter [Spirochaetaceae bacterium]